MMVSMLWFDTSNGDLVRKIETALRYYYKKFGRFPEMVVISEKDAQGIDLSETSKMTSVLVKASKTVQPNHLWIGVEEALPTAGSEQ